MSLQISLAVIIICVILSGFFSGMEIAFISSNRMHIALEKKQGNLSARLMYGLSKNPKKFITTMLIGNNVALVVYTIFMTEFIKNTLFSHSLLNEFWILLITTIISTLIILIFAEFFPKSIFSIYANKLLLFFAVPVFFIYHALSFLTTFIMWISNRILRLFGEKGEGYEKAFDKKDLEFYIHEQIEGVEEEKLDSEIQIFQNALEFKEIKARECMIPRKEIVAMPLKTTIKKVIEKFVETGRSKIIIYHESIDNIIGYVHSFELFKRPEHVKNILLPVEFVHETTTAREVMNRLIKKRKSIAVVLDEYGGTSGLITIEDIIEELFGEIEDEHDKITLTEEKISENKYLFSARLEVDYLNHQYKLDLPEHEAYETLGGLIVHIAESIPEKGAQISIENFIFIIKKVSQARLDEVILIYRGGENE